MKFKNNIQFNDEFSKIPKIRFYPYVGKDFDSQEKRIMIFAHNTYTKPEKYEREQLRTNAKTHFADALYEYTYMKRWWTKTWRNFIKGTLGICFNYDVNSPPETLQKIDEFVNKICYTNYINDLVESPKANNIKVNKELVEKSKVINSELIKILGITHCICWGKPVFEYVTQHKNFICKESLKYYKKGFEYKKLESKDASQIIHILRVYHPSMPGFGVYKKETNEIIVDFLKK